MFEESSMNQNQNPQENTSAENQTPMTGTQPAQHPQQTQTPDGQNAQPQQTNTFTPAENYRRETPYANASAPQNPQPQQTSPYQQHAGYNGAPAQQNAYQNHTSGQTAFQTAGSGTPADKPPKKKNAFWKKAAAAVALALIFGVVSGAVIAGMTHRPASETTDTPTVSDSENGGKTEKPFNGSASGDLRSASDAMADALQKVGMAEQNTFTIPQIAVIMEPAMVSINCTVEMTVNSFFGTQTYEQPSSGSGIIVGENDTELLIVTNNHVIADANTIKVQFVDEQSIPALVKGTDAVNDLAVIVVKLEDIPKETMDAIAYAELGDSDALVIGEGVVAIGNALGFGQSVTNGIVSALSRAVRDSNGNTTYLIQTNAAINPGNSGGALVNMRGQVVGINSAKYADEAVEGMGFAIPINTALPILEELMARTTRVVVEDPEQSAYLGITPQNVTSAMTQAYGMPTGVYVFDMAKGSAADKAGFVKGDIITKFDGEVISSVSSLAKTLSYYKAGETITVVVQRYDHGEYVETPLTVTLDKRPAEEGAVQQP